MMMTRSIWTLALFLLVLHTHAFAAELTVRDPHIRSLELELLDDLQKGAHASPTLKALLDRLETSDVVVYLTFDHAMPAHMAGRVSLMVAVPGRRYLRISIDRRSVGEHARSLFLLLRRHLAEGFLEPSWNHGRFLRD